jgi:uncharacterized cofD-like protein
MDDSQTLIRLAEESLTARLAQLSAKKVTPLDMLPQEDLREKLVELVLNGQPRGVDRETSALFGALRTSLIGRKVDETRVVVFGGGSGLSNVIGGDNRRAGWLRQPFSGLKEIFPHTRSVVCVTDDGGSTGEMLKDLPLVALGDIRHVLISSMQLEKLQKGYGLSVYEAIEAAASIAALFNYRFEKFPENPDALLLSCGVGLETLPEALRDAMHELIHHLFADPRLAKTLTRPHCLGNVLLAAAVYRNIELSLDNDALSRQPEILRRALYSGLNFLADLLGAEKRAVLPCTSTPAQLRVRYANGVQITGESKSSFAKRGVPVDRVYVDFHDEPVVYEEIFEDIRRADILILAPGSLYSSIIPIFRVPGLAECVRRNSHAPEDSGVESLGPGRETDLSISDPDRKFHVSDMIRAYERNIPGGTTGLFQQVLCLSLRDVPASVLQRYAVEGKIPIYLDRDIVKEQGYTPLECGIFSKDSLAERGVIQHDPTILAKAIKTLYVVQECFPEDKRVQIGNGRSGSGNTGVTIQPILPCQKYQKIIEILDNLEIRHGRRGGCDQIAARIRSQICGIIWKHQDIPLAHLEYIRGIRRVDLEDWRRDQRWDNVFSFFDPEERCIVIRRDQFEVSQKLEVAFLIALGESLLGDYAVSKDMDSVDLDGLHLGKVYHLRLREESERSCYFREKDLRLYLKLARMLPTADPCHYTRLINGEEGFTPPGLFMGLMYAWYLENQFASHIEYKMTVLKIWQSDLIPEQLKMLARRKEIISFFRDVVFTAPKREGKGCGKG